MTDQELPEVYTDRIPQALRKRFLWWGINKEHYHPYRWLCLAFLADKCHFQLKGWRLLDIDWVNRDFPYPATQGVRLYGSPEIVEGLVRSLSTLTVEELQNLIRSIYLKNIPLGEVIDFEMTDSIINGVFKEDFTSTI